MEAEKPEWNKKCCVTNDCKLLNPKLPPRGSREGNAIFFLNSITGLTSSSKPVEEEVLHFKNISDIYLFIFFIGMCPLAVGNWLTAD